MELEDMKTAWSKMDDRLHKQEIFSEKLVKEMLRDRSQRSISKLINLEAIGIGLCFVAIIVVVILAVRNHTHFMLFPTSLRYFLFFGFLYCLLAIIWQIFKLRELFRVNFAGSIRDNMSHINRYNLWIQREKTVLGIASVAFILGIFVMFAMLSFPLWTWIFMGCLFLGTTLLTVYMYKGIYDKSIASIRRSLEELKDLEEE